jgi:8-oxo-dGTP pyrophosphatase MutT (NUDIX family)
MNDRVKLTPFQAVRTRVHLFSVAMRKRLTLGVRAVLLDDRKVLLLKHTYLPGWQFPGGGVEPEETAEASAAREVIEETGYAVAGRPVLHGFYLNRLAGGARDHVAVYVWRKFSMVRAFVPNHEIAALGWFDIDALPEDVEGGTERRLREIFGGKTPDNQW